MPREPFIDPEELEDPNEPDENGAIPSVPISKRPPKDMDLLRPQIKTIYGTDADGNTIVSDIVDPYNPPRPGWLGKVNRSKGRIVARPPAPTAPAAPTPPPGAPPVNSGAQRWPAQGPGLQTQPQAPSMLKPPTTAVPRTGPSIAPVPSPNAPLPTSKSLPQSPAQTPQPTNPNTIYDPIQHERAQLESAMSRVAADRTLSPEQKQQVLDNIEKRAIALDETEFRRTQKEGVALAQQWADYYDALQAATPPTDEETITNATAYGQWATDNIDHFSTQAEAMSPGLGAALKAAVAGSMQRAIEGPDGARVDRSAKAIRDDWRRAATIIELVQAAEAHAAMPTKETEQAVAEAQRRVRADRSIQAPVGMYAPPGFVVNDRTTGMMTDTSTGIAYPSMALNNQLYPVTSEAEANRNLAPNSKYIDNTTYSLRTVVAEQSGGAGGAKGKPGASTTGEPASGLKRPDVESVLAMMREEDYVQRASKWQAEVLRLDDPSYMAQWQSDYIAKKRAQNPDLAQDDKALRADSVNAWAQYRESVKGATPMKRTSGVPDGVSVADVQKRLGKEIALYTQLKRIDAAANPSYVPPIAPTEHMERFSPVMPTEQDPVLGENITMFEVRPSPGSGAPPTRIKASYNGGELVFTPDTMRQVTALPTGTRFVDPLTGYTVRNSFEVGGYTRLATPTIKIATSDDIRSRVFRYAVGERHDPDELFNLARDISIHSNNGKTPDAATVSTIARYIVSISGAIAETTDGR